MRLLFIVPYVPTPIRVRPYNLIRSLVGLGHQVTLLTLLADEEDAHSLAALREQGVTTVARPLTRLRSAWNSVTTVLRPVPVQAAYCWQPGLLQVAQALVSDPAARFDLVHVEHLRAARYGTRLKSFMLGDGLTTPVVWDSVDCISHLFEQSARVSRSPFGRLITRFELPRTRWYEAWLARQFDRLLVTAEEDRRAFSDLVRTFAPPLNGQGHDIEKIQVLRNGVDLQYFRPTHSRRQPRTVVLTGKMSYHANVTAALVLVKEIMPRVWEKMPNARVEIVGQNPPAQVRSLARLAPDRVVVTGTVDDLRPYLAGAAVAVAPVTYGAGIQNKVLEAMAMAAPVVTTSRAVSALDVRDGEHALIADDPTLFSQQIIRLLRNPSLGERLGENARRYVQEKHDWKLVGAELEALYRQVIAEHRLA